MGCWYGGGCLIWDDGVAVAALYWMLVWRWQPYMGCWGGGGCLKWHGIVLSCASEEVTGLI